MNTIVHHQPLTGGLSWNMHVWEAAWDGNQVWDVPATLGGTRLISKLPEVPDVRALQFKYNSTSSATGQTVWEADELIRRGPFLAAPNENLDLHSSRSGALHQSISGGRNLSCG